MTIEPTREEYDALGRALLARARRADRRKRGLGLVAVGASAIAVTALLGGIVRMPDPGASPGITQAQGSADGDHDPAFSAPDPAPQLAGAGVEVACYPSASLSAAPVTVGRQALAFNASKSMVEHQVLADCRALWAAGVVPASVSGELSAYGLNSESDSARKFDRSSAHFQACQRSATQYVVFPDTDLQGRKLCDELQLATIRDPFETSSRTRDDSE